MKSFPSTILVYTCILFAQMAATASAQSDPKFLLLPEEQALAMHSAMEDGTRLTPYDKGFLLWTAIFLSSPDCGIVSEQEKSDLELSTLEAMISTGVTNPVEMMQAQFSSNAHLAMLAAVSNPCGPDYSDSARQLIFDIVDVLAQDNLGSRSDIVKDLEDREILPKSEPNERSDGLASAPLNEFRVMPLGQYNLDLMCISGATDASGEICDRIQQLIGSGSHQTITCVYGPFYQDGTGFETYQFWYGTMPDDFETYEIAGKPHPFGPLGTAVIEECPANSQAAMDFRSRNGL
jgi:hypothetical protein